MKRPFYIYLAALCILLAILLLPCFQTFAQQGTAEPGTADVRGTVLTEKGELLQGATVVAHNTANNQSLSSVTDENGVFLFRKLIVGNKYDFSFTFSGYEAGEFK